MGYLRHKILVVNHFSAERLEDVRMEVLGVFAGHRDPIVGNFSDMVGPVVRHPVNGGGTFVVVPDGSKEGWTASDAGDALLNEAMQLLERWNRTDSVDWCLLLMGGDDDEFGVLRTSGSVVAPHSYTP